MPALRNEIRVAMRERRAALPGAFAADGAMACAEHLLGLRALAEADVVAAYAAVRGELDTAPLVRPLRARGVSIAYPRVAQGSRRLEFHLVDDDGELECSALGIPEPRPDRPLIPLAAIRAFVVPGLAFDRTGGRLGWGGGYYDSTLAAAPDALRIGYAFDFQVVPAIPAIANDERVDFLATDMGVRPTAFWAARQPRRTG